MSLYFLHWTCKLMHYNREPGSYAISARAKEQVKHFRVMHKAGENYVIGKCETVLLMLEWANSSL